MKKVTVGFECDTEERFQDTSSNSKLHENTHEKKAIALKMECSSYLF